MARALLEYPATADSFCRGELSYSKVRAITRVVTPGTEAQLLELAPYATASQLERIVAGRLNKQIAADLGISIKTVEAHRANIMDKLEANTVADLMRVALRSVAPVES